MLISPKSENKDKVYTKCFFEMREKILKGFMYNKRAVLIFLLAALAVSGSSCVNKKDIENTDDYSSNQSSVSVEDMTATSSKLTVGTSEGEVKKDTNLSSATEKNESKDDSKQLSQNNQHSSKPSQKENSSEQTNVEVVTKVVTQIIPVDAEQESKASIDVSSGSSSVNYADGNTFQQIHEQTKQLYISSLTEQQLECYQQTVKAISEFETHVTFSEIGFNSENAQDFITLISLSCPEYIYLGGKYTVFLNDKSEVVAIDVEYTMSKEDYEAKNAEMNTKIDEIIHGMWEGMSDYQKVQYIHDYLISNCSYSDEGENSYNAYGCIVDKKAVCEGYSKAMQTICSRVGIPCVCVTGIAYPSWQEQGENHMWNMVRIDGNWYHIDLTWDDPMTNIGEDYIRYDYFNVSDDFIFQDHTIVPNSFITVNKAESYNANYFAEHGYLIYDASTAEDILAKAIVETANGGKRFARIQCKDIDTFNAVYKNIFEPDEFNTKKIFSVLRRAVEQSNKIFADNSYSVIKSERTNTITVILDNVS